MVTNVSKNTITISTSPKSEVEDFMLLENGFYVLQESGYKIILEQSVLDPVPVTNVSKGVSTITNVTKS